MPCRLTFVIVNANLSRCCCCVTDVSAERLRKVVGQRVGDERDDGRGADDHGHLEDGQPLPAREDEPLLPQLDVQVGRVPRGTQVAD